MNENQNGGLGDGLFELSPRQSPSLRPGTTRGNLDQLELSADELSDDYDDSGDDFAATAMANFDGKLEQRGKLIHLDSQRLMSEAMEISRSNTSLGTEETNTLDSDAVPSKTMPVDAQNMESAVQTTAKSPNRGELRVSRRDDVLKKAMLSTQSSATSLQSNVYSMDGSMSGGGRPQSTDSSTDINRDTSIVSPTSEELAEEERILKQAAESQIVLKRAAKLAAAQGISVDNIQVVDKHGAFVSVPTLKLEIDAAVAVRQKQKERSRAGRKASQTAAPEFNCVALEDMVSRHPEEQMRFAFKLADLNGDGRVTKDELEESLKQFAADGVDEEEDWALQHLTSLLEQAFAAGGSNSTYVDETHIAASKTAEEAAGAPLSVTLEELLALKRWSVDVTYFEKVFSPTFLRLLRTSFVAACHDTAHSHLSGEDNVPWLRGVPCSSSTGTNEPSKECVGKIAFLNADQLQSINIVQKHCGGDSSIVKGKLNRYDLTNAGFLKMGDLSRALQGVCSGSLSDENINALATACVDVERPDHYLYRKLGDYVDATITLVSQDAGCIDRMIDAMAGQEGDTIVSPKLERYTNDSHDKPDQWDVFPAALAARAWKLLGCIRGNKLLANMISPGPKVVVINGSSKDGIPLHSPTDEITNPWDCKTFRNSLWVHQMGRKYEHVVEANPTGNGIRMKTTPSLEEDECSDAIVWVRLLGYMYDHRASLRKDALTEKERKALEKKHRMGALARPRDESPTKLRREEEQLERERRRKKKERERAAKEAEGQASFEERMDMKIAESRRKKEEKITAYENSLKQLAQGKQAGKKADTLGFLKRLQESEELKEKKRQDMVRDELRKSKPRKKKGSTAEKISRLSVSLTTKQKQLAEDAFNKFDVDQSGYIDVSELEQIVESCGETLSRKETDELMRNLDTNGDGTVEKSEFMAWWTCRCPACRFVKEREPVPGRNRRKIALGTDDGVEWAKGYGVVTFDDPGQPPSKEMLICGSCYDVYKRDRFIQRLDKAEHERQEKMRLNGLAKQIPARRR